MSKINYPKDWMGIESMSLIINFPELVKLAKANGLDSGHLTYLINAITNTTLGTINKMLEDSAQLEKGSE